MSTTSAGWGPFERNARTPDPDTIRQANTLASPWGLQGNNQYTPDDVYFATQDQHHHSHQLNVKIPENWIGMLNEFVAKNDRFRSVHDVVRTALVHQVVYEGLREQMAVVLSANDPAFKAPLILSEVIDAGITQQKAKYDGWEKRLRLFTQLCEKMVEVGDTQGLAEELNKHDVEYEDTDMLPHFRKQFRGLVKRFNLELRVMKTRDEFADDDE